MLFWRYMDTVLIEAHYFPSIAVVRSLVNAPSIKVEGCETYQKNSFRNRCVIAGSNGLMTLSVPLERGRDQKALYRDIQISYADNWQVQHLRSITSCYRRAPYFEYFYPAVEYILQKRHSFLFDLNTEILQWIVKICKISASIGMTEDFILDYVDGVIDCRNKWKPSNYQEQTESLPYYYQLFEDRIGFKPNLSVLDAIFCAGPNHLS